MAKKKPTAEEKKLISSITDGVKNVDKSRTEFKKQALINVMFLYGKHHLDLRSSFRGADTLDQRIIWEIEKIRKASDVRRVSNYILPLFRSLYSRIIRMKATIMAEALTNTERDRDAAKVTQETMEDFWDTCNQGNPWMSEFVSMQPVIMRLVLYMLTLGNGYLFPYFNSKANTMLYDKEKDEVFESDAGEVEARVISPLNMFRDRFGRFFIERRFISPEQVYYEYDKEVDPVKTEMDLVEMQIRRLLEGEVDEEAEKDGVYVYTKFCLPEKKYKKGRMIVCTDNEILFESNEIPEEYNGKIPIFNNKYQDLGFTSHSQGAIEQVIDLQQDYNETLTRISSYKKKLSGKLLVPRGAKLSAKFDSNTGQIVNYNKGYRPTYEDGSSPPAYIIQELMRIRRDMEDLMNSHDTSMGRPGGVKSGVAIDSLSENDFSMISPELVTFEMSLSKFSDCVSYIMTKKYTEPRLLRITGEDMAYEVNSFIGSSLSGQKRVKIRMGSGLPGQRRDRQNYIEWLLKMQLITPDQAKKMLEVFDVNGIVKSLDEIGAKNDILNIIDGKGEYSVMAEPFEDHVIRLKIINDFRKGSKYAKLDPKMKQAIDDLAKQHQEFLLSEQEAAGGAGKLPPPAMPQMQ